MHVVDAIATDGPSVVAEVILNSGVPHLQLIESKGEMQNFREFLGQGLLPLQVLGWCVGWTGQRFQ